MNASKHIDRAGFYPRVSRTNGRDAEELERHTISEQRELALGFLPREVELVERELWKDVNVSGRNFDRPGLHRLFEAVENGEVNAVAVGYLSRFGRNTRELLENVRRLRELGATLYIGKERLTILPNDDDPMTNLILTILAAIAELEGARLREQLGRANRTAVTNGVSIQVPYGYRRSNGAGSVLEPDDDALHMPDGWTPAIVVIHIFQRRADGAGDSELARELNELGIPTPTALEYARRQRRKPGSKLWKHNTVSNVVECHTYRGVIPRGTEFVGEGKRRRAVAWEYLAGEHEALVSAEAWESAQRRRRPAIRNGSTGNALLGGLVRCGSCSQTMRPSGERGGLSYRCRGRKAGCAAPVSIAREGLERYVVEQLLEGQTQALISTREDRAELELAEAAAREAQRVLDDFDRYADPGEWGKGFMSARRQRVAARDDAELTAARLRSALRAGEQRSLAGFDELPMDERREALGDLLDAVVIFPAADLTRAARRDLPARVELCFAGRAPFELSGTGRIVGPRPWPRS